MHQIHKRTRIANLVKRKATTAFIPEGLTCYLQPVDTHVNKSAKQNISDHLQEKIEEKCRGDFWL
jgi:hypothetical protein